jgi:tRNA(Arg) A34 adenosine deaminase TadA
MTGPSADRDDQPLRAAIEVARSSREQGNHPFGAILADAAGSVLASAENTVVTDADATGHAETNLVRIASRTWSPAELATMTLYASTEPCAMCAGALYWSGIGRLVYALGEDELLQMTGDDPENSTMSLPCRTVLAAGQRPIEVIGPVPVPSAREVHEGFWRPLTA